MENFLNHLKSLVQLSVSDQSFDKREKTLIYSIGKANKVPEPKIDSIIAETLQNKENVSVSFSALSFDDKFEYLYNIVQLMKIDNAVFLSEVRYCEDLAGKLGFDKKVVQKMSARVYSDPAITADRDSLKREIKKFEL